MKVSLLVIVIVVLTFPSVRAQTARNEARTSVPADARFEIVQSNIAVKFTVRLDKFLGNVHMLVEDDEGSLVWERVDRESYPKGEIMFPGRVNYQIFTSGLAIKSTFLININTGATWVLVENAKTSTQFWEAIPKPSRR